MPHLLPTDISSPTALTRRSLVIGGATAVQRIPGVAAGRVVYSDGNINYGSIYTATKGLELLNELFGTVEN